jgi:hypothetical protein
VHPVLVEFDRESFRQAVLALRSLDEINAVLAVAYAGLG